jgi:hypothetical protein
VISLNIWIIINLVSYVCREFRTSRSADLRPYTSITGSRVFAEPRGSDAQKISGPLFAAKVAFLIFPDRHSFKFWSLWIFRFSNQLKFLARAAKPLHITIFDIPYCISSSSRSATDQSCGRYNSPACPGYSLRLKAHDENCILEKPVSYDSLNLVLWPSYFKMKYCTGCQK